MPEEIAFFGRSGLFGLGLAVVYWFVSYEVAGTLLLGGFGLATGAAFLVLRSGRRPARARASAAATAATAASATAAASEPSEPPEEGPFADEGGPVTLSSVAPLEVGFGLAVMALGLAFGIWFVLAGLLPLALGAADWLSSEMRGG